MFAQALRCLYAANHTQTSSFQEISLDELNGRRFAAWRGTLDRCEKATYRSCRIAPAWLYSGAIHSEKASNDVIATFFGLPSAVPGTRSQVGLPCGAIRQ